MRILFLFALLVVGCAHADMVLKNNGTVIGPVVMLDCTRDGGLVCTRTNGSATGSLSCASATNNTPGCVSNSAQIFSGTKTIDGGLTVQGPVLIDGGVNIRGQVNVDGGLYVNGPVWIDGGTNINANLIVDGGVSASSLTSRSGFYFFNVRADGGQSYMEGDDPTGKIGMGTNGVYLNAGISIAQVGHFCGYTAGITDPGNAATRRPVAYTQFAAPEQFLRLVGIPARPGLSDGGVGQDGGAQTWFVDVYNATTSTVLCHGSEVLCSHAVGGVVAGPSSTSITGSSVAICATDGGALVATGDLVLLTVNDVDCWNSPPVNVCAEYGGLPQ